MVVNIFYIIAIIGLASIILGTFLLSLKKRMKKIIFPLLLIGGICLLIYSIYIQDIIFIILQSVYIIITIYGIIKLHKLI